MSEELEFHEQYVAWSQKETFLHTKVEVWEPKFYGFIDRCDFRFILNSFVLRSCYEPFDLEPGCHKQPNILLLVSGPRHRILDHEKSHVFIMQLGQYVLALDFSIGSEDSNAIVSY